MPDLHEFQEKIRELYGKRDEERGLYQNFAWLVEEIGELSRALRCGDRENLELEFADVTAWLVSVANVAGIERQMKGILDFEQSVCAFQHLNRGNIAVPIVRTPL